MPKHFGLDIGSTSVKLVDSDGKKVHHIGIVNSIGKNLTQMNAVERGQLVDVIKKLIGDSGTSKNQAVLSISESLVYSKVMKFPTMSTPELATAIKWELDQTVPFPPDEVETSWSMMDKENRFNDSGKQKVYVVAVPTKISDLYVDLMTIVGVEIARLENETPSLVRTYSGSLSSEEAVLVVDIGATGSNLLCLSKDIVLANYFSPIGGNVLTKYIADSFALPVSQAEQYKRVYGIQKEVMDGKIFNALKPVVDGLFGEVKKMLIDFQNNFQGKTISRVVLSGGSSYLNGLVSYGIESLGGVEIVMGDVFYGMQVDNKYKILGPVFSTAFGLAI